MRLLLPLLSLAVTLAAGASSSPKPLSRVIPVEYLPPATVRRVVLHWTAGAYAVSAIDRDHYHVILGPDRTAENDVKAVRGVWTPRDNEFCRAGRYAPHTRGLNSHSFGLAVACMAGAEEGGPYGRYPLTHVLWERQAQAAAEVCFAYELDVNPRSVLQHWEVTKTYGIVQRGKWDCGELPFDTDRTPQEVADAFRRKVLWYLHRLRSLRPQK